MFTQLLHYVAFAIQGKHDKHYGDEIPPFLVVVDKTKAALMKTEDVFPLFKDNKVKWGKSASQFDRETLQQISNYIGTHFVSFKIAEEEREFIGTVKSAIETKEIIRVRIKPSNLKQVFDRWVSSIGCEIAGVKESNYALLFFADIMQMRQRG